MRIEMEVNLTWPLKPVCVELYMTEFGFAA